MVPGRVLSQSHHTNQGILTPPNGHNRHFPTGLTDVTLAINPKTSLISCRQQTQVGDDDLTGGMAVPTIPLDV